MDFEIFVRAVLESIFSQSEEELIDLAVKAICNYSGKPTMKNEGKTIEIPKYNKKP